MKRADTIVRVSLTLLFLYMFGVGATLSGIVVPDFKINTLGLLTVLAIFWMYLGWREKWEWYKTPLDPALLLWVAAFALSLLANMEAWRHILMALWYMALYILIFYALSDLIANHSLKRSVIIDAYMFAGLLIVIFGYIQIARADINLAELELPRPGSLLGNSNFLGTFLVILITLVGGRMFYVRAAIGRWMLGIYALSSLILLGLTYSRTSWIALMAAGGALIMFVFYGRGIRSPRALWGWWLERSRVLKLSLAIIMLGVAVFAVAAVVLIFRVEGDLLSGRGPIYEGAAMMFMEKPLTGHGLFTFGEELLRFESVPPKGVHSHAHNAFLHVGAELGVAGLIALGASVVIVLYRVVLNLRQSSAQQRHILVPVSAALVGFGVSHLGDFTSMMPLIAVSGLILVVIASTPLEPQPITSGWRKEGQPLAMALLIAVLIITGFVSADVYRRYYDTLRSALNQQTANPAMVYKESAARIARQTQIDPYLPVYTSQRAYLLGLAANEGDLDALIDAQLAYEEYLELQPNNAVAWANKAALEWQAEIEDLAIDAMERAVELAPDASPFHFTLAQYYEATGQQDAARAHYDEALSWETRLWPEWQDTALTREVLASYDVAPEEEDEVTSDVPLALALVAGDTDLPRYPAEDETSSENTKQFVLQALIALRTGEGTPRELLLRAHDERGGQIDEAWIRFGQAILARSQGDAATAQAALDRTRELIQPTFDDAEFPNAMNRPHLVWLRLSISRRFLPQVFYPYADQTLRYLLANESALP